MDLQTIQHSFVNKVRQITMLAYEYGQNNQIIPALSKFQEAKNLLESPLPEGVNPEIAKQLLQYIEEQSSYLFGLLKKPTNLSKENQHPADNNLQKQIEGTIVETTGFNLGNVCGLEDVKRLLEENIILPITHSHLMKNTPAVEGILLFGPPGTGKSFIARATCGQTKTLTYFSVSASELMSNDVGESEEIIACLFNTARMRKPSLIFIDELDLIGRKRNDMDFDSTRRIKTELLVQMKGGRGSNENVFVIGATNFVGELDEAVQKLFPKLTYIPLPDKESRLQMFDCQLMRDKGNKKSGAITRADIDCFAEMTKGFSGSDISNVCKLAKRRWISRLNSSKYFKKDSSGKYVPCSAEDPDREEIRLSEVAPEMVFCDEVVTKDDVKNEIRQKKPTTDSVAEEKYNRMARKKIGWRGNYEVPEVTKTSFWEDLTSCLLTCFD